jgi:hypothetical protein
MLFIEDIVVVKQSYRSRLDNNLRIEQSFFTANILKRVSFVWYGSIMKYNSSSDWRESPWSLLITNSSKKEAVITNIPTKKA